MIETIEIINNKEYKLNSCFFLEILFHCTILIQFFFEYFQILKLKFLRDLVSTFFINFKVIVRFIS